MRSCWRRRCRSISQLACGTFKGRTCSASKPALAARPGANTAASALQVLNVARLAGNLQEQGEQTRQQAVGLAVRLQKLEQAHGAPCKVQPAGR